MAPDILSLETFQLSDSSPVTRTLYAVPQPHNKSGKTAAAASTPSVSVLYLFSQSTHAHWEVFDKTHSSVQNQTLGCVNEKKKLSKL